MVRKTIVWLTLSLLIYGGSAWGQCGCQQCGNSATSLDDCIGSRDWERDFFDCCEPAAADYQICDPCCRLPYVSVYGGYGSIDGLKRGTVIANAVNVINPGTPPNLTDFLAETTETVREQGIDVVDGFAVGGTIGYRVHPKFRMEADFAYRENEAGSIFTTDTTTIRRFTDPSLTGGQVVGTGMITTTDPATGTIRSYSGLANGLYDLTIPRLRCFNVYGGGGIGLINVTGDVVTATENFRISSTSFAYQLIGGVNVPLTRRAEFFSEYKYLGADNLTIDDVNLGASLGRFGLDSHNVVLGIRFYPGKRDLLR